MRATIKFGLKIFLGLTALIILMLLLLMSYSISLQNQDREKVKPESGIFVSAYDTKIFVQSAGRKDSPAIVFIHGTGAWSEIWRPSMDLVASLGYRAIAIDLPPFGYSLPPMSGKYHKGEQAKRILAVLDSLGIERASFVSHSIGSAPLMEAILNSPERVDQLVLVCAALGLDEPQSNGADTGIQTILRQQWVSQTLSAALMTNPLFTESLMKSFVSEKEKITPEWISLYQRPLKQKDSYKAVAMWLPELMAARGLSLSDQVDLYKTIQFPVHLIWGAQDNVTPLIQAKHLHQLIPNSDLNVIARSGHVPMVEEPKEFAQSLQAIFSRSGYAN